MTENQTKVNPKRQAIDEYFHNIEESEAIVFDGLDDAILGVAEQYCGVGPLVAYSLSGILACLRADGMAHEEAMEYFGHNIQCLAVNEGTPIIVDDYTNELDHCCEGSHE